ncbi:MAG: TIGR00730 family Rossman fold protein, partial [Planctomycetota bacterium]|nr:TIGR00730 family Rossman fold protein [Planctomycetota bacterium]
CGHTLVYGGGSTGIMGILANVVLQNGGKVIGVIPQHLARPELMHDRVSDMRITIDMHTRKALMHSLADAYIALPGGYGTLEELFEAVTWSQLALHSRPVKVLNINGLFDGLVAMLDQMTHHGFLSLACRQHLEVYSTTEESLPWVASLPSDSDML